MATIFLTWELGAGLGHLVPMRVLGRALVQRGHQVIAAVRDLNRVADLFAGTGIAFLPSPVFISRGKLPFPKVEGFSHILANVGYADPSIISSLFSAWNTLFNCVRPSVVVTDYAPTALLALRGLSIPRVAVCPAFCSPPDISPLPYWWNGRHDQPLAQMLAHENELLQNVNGVLTAHGRPLVQRMGQIFQNVEELILSTYRELDPFNKRPETRYWGHWHDDGGVEPRWPAGVGPKVYVYLKRSPLIGELLGALRAMGCPAIVLAREIDPALQRQHAGPSIVFEARPLKMQAVAAQCDLAILNGGHGTTASMLLAGKPCFLFPSHIEQLFTAQAIARSGAGRFVSPNNNGQIAGILREMVDSPRYKVAAQGFASRYAGFVPGQQVGEIVDHIEAWIGKTSSRDPQGG